MFIKNLIHKSSRYIIRIPVLGPYLRSLAGGKLYIRYRVKHPFDKEHGIDTSGFFAGAKLAPTKILADKINDYTAVQPSLVRDAIKALPDISDFSFIDLGCGKGRAMIVASKFPFHKIVGVEIAPKLAAVARENARVIAEKFPSRTKIEVVEGNAVAFPVPSRKIVLFLFNPFGDELIKALVENINKRVGKDIDQLFVIYHNPVWSDAFDASPALQRWYIDIPTCDPHERNYGPEKEGPTVIWQSSPAAHVSPHARVNRKVIRINPLMTGLAE